MDLAFPVFISYARQASRAHALALHRALGGGVAFLDTEEIEQGERFDERVVDALFDAQVVVVLAEPVYFTRWYCLLEFGVARRPYLDAAERPESTPAQRAEAIRSLVIALPTAGAGPKLTERFPALLDDVDWPAMDDTAAVARHVRARLAANPPTLRDRYLAWGDPALERARLLSATRLPQPVALGAIPIVRPPGLQGSIGDAFVGRADDLWRVHDVLTTRRGSMATAAGLTGSVEAGGGFGKTRLAIEYLHRFAAREFRGGLFWIDAEDDAELQLYDVLRALDPGAVELAEVRRQQGGIRSAVARAVRALPPGSPPPLFVIDNVPEPEPGQAPLPLDTWCPVLGEVAVLATSRRHVSTGSPAAWWPSPSTCWSPTRRCSSSAPAWRRTGWGRPNGGSSPSGWGGSPSPWSC